MSTKRNFAVKKPLKGIENNSFVDHHWNARNRTVDDFYYPNCYSSMKLDFHRSQFDYNKNEQQNHRPYSNVYSSAIVCGSANSDGKNFNLNNKKAELFSNNATITSLYRSTPLLNYSANSYFGWHHNRNSGGTLPLQSVNKPTVSEFNKFYTIEKGTAYNTNNQIDLLNMQGSLSSVRTTPSQFGSSLMNIKRNRLKICVVVAILTIMVAVLIAMGVAVYSQVNNESIGLKVVRQYQGSFTVTNNDPHSNFEREALNKDSEEFKKMSLFFTKKIDALLRDSGFNKVYEGSEVLNFRFPIAASSMEVHFILKTKVDVILQVQDILAVFENGIQKNGVGIFNNMTVDLDSLTIENEQFDRNFKKQTTKIPLEN